MCYHIVRWYESMRAAPAIRRCYRTMSTAQTIRRRGITGDRSDGYLDPGADLAIAKCRDEALCECSRWPEGHNVGNLPVKESKRVLACDQCGKRRRAVVEIIDPKSEQPEILCEPCARRVALAYLFKRQMPPVRRLHADDPSMRFVADGVEDRGQP